MVIHSIDFIGSFERVSQCPESRIPEYAFIGRSNVGKSSLINLLCRRKDIARVSNTPGKTQHLNYYLVNESWHLVDLPGFGYAQISKKKREEWAKTLKYYLTHREQLTCIMFLVDGSIPPQKIDLEFMAKLGEWEIPFVIIFTKVDKAKKQKFSEIQANYLSKLSEFWEPLPTYFHSSSTKGEGREEILTFIEGVNTEYERASA